MALNILLYLIVAAAFLYVLKCAYGCKRSLQHPKQGGGCGHCGCGEKGKPTQSDK